MNSRRIKGSAEPAGIGVNYDGRCSLATRIKYRLAGYISGIFFKVAGSGPITVLARRIVLGECNICGCSTGFLSRSDYGIRETLECLHCGSINRYRSIARGILNFIEDRTGIRASSLRDLKNHRFQGRIVVLDTQPDFVRFGESSYRIPSFLRDVKWIEVHVSSFNPTLKPGEPLGIGHTNQNLENLTFEDRKFDIVITSDVMEHVRLPTKAHKEIYRVLKAGGSYLFTVPHSFEMGETQHYITVTDPNDPARDIVVREEYHSDQFAARQVPVYRIFGRELLENLEEANFQVKYIAADTDLLSIFGAELFDCRVPLH